MNAKKTLTGSLYCCGVLVLSACTHLHLRDPVGPSLPLYGFKGSIVSVSDTIIVKKGQTFDGAGNLYQWVGEGDCSQKEGMPSMFDLQEGAILKNLWMENAPDGIHIKGANVVIDSIVNVDVCEDAISISRNKAHLPVHQNIKITNSRFFHCQDKAIQLTRGSNILIKGNTFYNCAKAVRVKEQAHEVYFENNRVFSSKHAIKVTGGSIYIKDNYIQGARTGLWAEENGTIINQGRNAFINVELNTRESDGGRVIAQREHSGK